MPKTVSPAAARESRLPRPELPQGPGGGRGWRSAAARPMESRNAFPSLPARALPRRGRPSAATAGAGGLWRSRRQPRTAATPGGREEERRGKGGREGGMRWAGGSGAEPPAPPSCAPLPSGRFSARRGIPAPPAAGAGRGRRTPRRRPHRGCLSNGASVSSLWPLLSSLTCLNKEVPSSSLLPRPCLPQSARGRAARVRVLRARRVGRSF